MLENDGNAQYLSEERIMESVGSPEEEGTFNTPMPEPHTILSSSLSPLFSKNAANTSVDISLVNDNDCSEDNNDGATETLQ